MNIGQLAVEARVETLNLTLFDYQLTNDGVMDLSLRNSVAEIGTRVNDSTFMPVKLRGEGTNLQLSGSVDLEQQTIDMDATGDANLGILQGFFRSLRSSGSATLAGGITGSLQKPVFSGKATLSNGRIRHFQMPRSLDNINGTITFDASGIRLDSVDPESPPLTARFGGGTVTFGGRIIMNGFVPDELNLTANGERMALNYPEGFRSEINADLALRGTLRAPVLTGVVTVLSARYDRRFQPAADLFNFGGEGAGLPGVPVTPSSVPLRFDIEIDAPGTLQIDNNLARLTATADLRLQGTYDQPILTGRAEIVRGDVTLLGNRYQVRGPIDFANPRAIDPYFDIEAETRIRVADQTYRVTINLLGTANRLVPTLTSDPPLPTSDIIELVLGKTPDLTDADLRSLTASDRAEEQLIEAIGALLLGQPISGPVEDVVGRVLGGGTTVQIIPGFGTGGEGDPFLASARVVIGQRISNRVYLTFAHALGTTREQIIVLEFDQSDRLSWIITQNVDRRSFAIDFRVRHVF
jgi:translocation and assembly module TamB